jgi:hypothetical protein
MPDKEENVDAFVKKVSKVIKDNKLDVSSDEDLSVGIMNLLAIEEHLFFTAQKTNNNKYYEMLRQTREIRKMMLAKIVKDAEGEVWCTSKHLLSASMRLMEVGTKALGKGDDKQAHELFDKSYDLYALFWALNLGQLKGHGEVTKTLLESFKEEGYMMPSLPPSEEEKPGFLGKMRTLLKKAIDCCKE